jgi:hypothetical protein
VAPIAPSGQLIDSLAPAKLRKDGLRLGLLAALSIVYALLFEQPILDVVLIALNGIGAVVAILAVIVAGTAIRRHGRPALLALGVYAACLAGHVAAVLLLVG